MPYRIQFGFTNTYLIDQWQPSPKTTWNNSANERRENPGILNGLPGVPPAGGGSVEQGRAARRSLVIRHRPTQKDGVGINGKRIITQLFLAIWNISGERLLDNERLKTIYFKIEYY